MKRLTFLCFISILCGVALAADRESCMRENDMRKIVECIKNGFYDPCDWGWGGGAT